MGGYRSGRWGGYSTKTVVEDCLHIETNWMTQQGVLRVGKCTNGVIQWTNRRTGEERSSIGYEINVPGEWLRLQYHLSNRNESFDYRVGLTNTPLPWGGVRWWFICPQVLNERFCGRRVGKLYLPPGARHFACRTCYNLTYQSCNDSHRFDGVFKELGVVMGMDPAHVARIMKDW